MKKNILSVIAAALALALAFAGLPVIPVSAVTFEPCWTVPSGYNAHDYDKCAAFLEQADESGVKNGEKLSENYDPNDPDTWGTYEQYSWDEDGNMSIYDAPRFEWAGADGELRICYIIISDREYDEAWGLVGTLDVSGCTELIEVSCEDSFIEALDLTGCTGLFHVNCSSNRLTELDVSDCPELTNLECGSNALTGLDVSHNPNLQTLMCQLNSIPELDVSNHPMLCTLICYNNELTELDVSHNPELSYLDCDCNALTELDLSANPLLEILYCNWDELTELDVSNNPMLTCICCFGNMLTGIDVSNNPELLYFDCSENLITGLDLSGNNALQYFSCRQNPMTELILPDNPDFFRVRTLRAEGAGFVGCYVDGLSEFTVFAESEDSVGFLGWYDETGALVSEEDCFRIQDGYYTVLTARFEGGAVPGDVDGNGNVNVTDAIIALRGAMGVIELTDEQIAAGDVNGDGVVNVIDALTVLRMAMGIA
ncbi:MAG: hypothetical protein IK064_03540 [Clostridia bacterium]|nr:hypothetical protein [Clostridia bacterium]